MAVSTVSTVQPHALRKREYRFGTKCFRRLPMTSTVMESFGVASILAHLLLIGIGLFIAGHTVKAQSSQMRLLGNLLALGALITALVLADLWLERGVLIFWALVASPVLLGLVVIREHQVGVVIKKFAARSLPAGQFIALHGEARYQAETLPPGVHLGYLFSPFCISKTTGLIVPSVE